MTQPTKRTLPVPGATHPRPPEDLKKRAPPTEPAEVLGRHENSGRGFIALLEAFRATGGTAPGDVVGRLLEDHHAGDAVSLAKLIYTRQVFGFEWRSRLWIPMFQFDANDLSIKPGPQQVRAELPSMWPGWTFAWWFAAPNLQLDDHSPVDEMDAHLDATVRAARATQSKSNRHQPTYELAGARFGTP